MNNCLECKKLTGGMCERCKEKYEEQVYTPDKHWFIWKNGVQKMVTLVREKLLQLTSGK
jgi:hypothetical protein